MATRILNRTLSLTASQALIESGTGDTPKAGLTWVITEIRPYFQGKGDFFLFIDDQQLIQISSEDVATYGKPHVVGIQIKQPVIIHSKFTDRSALANAVGVDIVIEETGTPA